MLLAELFALLAIAGSIMGLGAGLHALASTRQKRKEEAWDACIKALRSNSIKEMEEALALYGRDMDSQAREILEQRKVDLELSSNEGNERT